MSTFTLFIDRDGTLIEEPHDNQVDSLAKVRFMPGVFAALAELRERGYRFVIVTNQNGLGTPDFPFGSFTEPHEFMLNAFASQAIRFDEVFVCPHRPNDGCACRKPKIGLVTKYLRDHDIDLTRSAVIGDRDSDLEMAANLGILGLRVRRGGASSETWPSVVQALIARRSHEVRQTAETRVDARINLDETCPLRVSTGIAFFDHMLEQLAKHGGFSLELGAVGDLHIDEHHTVEDTAITLGNVLHKALGDKAGIARYGFVLPMDEAEARVSLDLSGRPFSKFVGKFPRDRLGQFPTELVPHFFRSFAEGLRAAVHVSVAGENTHHMVEACFKGVGRALRQAIRRDGTEIPSTKGVL